MIYTSLVRSHVEQLRRCPPIPRDAIPLFVCLSVTNWTSIAQTSDGSWGTPSFIMTNAFENPIGSVAHWKRFQSTQFQLT